MRKSVFISYSHKQGDWVANDLVKILEAAGLEVLIDSRHFGAGKAVVGQMDKLQDQADISLLVFSPDYLKSTACQHEMKRAIAKDPNFTKGITIPIKRKNCQLPVSITAPDPLYIKLTAQEAKKNPPWDQLLSACGTSLKASAPEWLEAHKELLDCIERNISVNLVVSSGQPEWSYLLDSLHYQDKVIEKIDMNSGETAPRQGLINLILKKCACLGNVREPPNDLLDLANKLSAKQTRCCLILHHFDIVSRRQDVLYNYDVSLFAAIRNLVMDKRKLQLIIQSRTPYANLLPANHPLSELDIRNVELQAR